MGLPNADRAEVDLRKDCLSFEHPVVKHKAIVFRAALGLTAADAHVLREQSLRAAVDGPAVLGRADEFGDRYRLDFRSGHPIRSNPDSVGVDHPGG